MLWTTYLWNLLLGCLLTRPAAALLGATQMLVFTNNITPGPGTVTADLTEPTYAGYARQAVTVVGPYVTVDGKLAIHIPDTEWTLPAGQPGQTYQGFGIVDGTGALVMVGKFDTPAVLPVPGVSIFVGGENILIVAQSMGDAEVEP